MASEDPTRRPAGGFDERSRHKAWIPGYSVQLDRKGEYEHWVGGACGGQRCEWEGDECPNCKKPLIQHLLLDTQDPRLKLQALGVPELPLLYCGRCCIAEEPFVYRVKPPAAIELVLFQPDNREDSAQDWYRHALPDVFPQRSIELQPIPDWMQDLILRMNADSHLSRQEEVRAGVEAGPYWSDGRPYFEGYRRQLGGIPYFEPHWGPPNCSACTELKRIAKMRFLACLRNDPSRWADVPRGHKILPPYFQQDFVISFDGHKIFFFLCPECYAVHVETHTT